MRPCVVCKGTNRRFFSGRCKSCLTCQKCQLSKHYKAFAAGSAVCTECSNLEQRRRCDVCEKRKTGADFDARILHHAIHHNRRAVCLACAAIGYSPKDVHGYPCGECGLKGHRKFSTVALNNYKYKKGKLFCIECNIRNSDIERRLSAEGRFRCTCPGRQNTRQHLPGNEKCALYKRFAGEERWPGKNVGVSRDDWLFHERVKKRRT